MSDALSGDALETDPAVSQDDTPGEGSTVEEGSAGGEEPKMVPAERLNGLMSKYQSEKSEWDRRFEAMEAELERLRNDKEETPVADGDGKVEQLQQTVEQLTEALASQTLEAARREALEEYPEAKPLADLIVGNSREEIRDVARVIAERLKSTATVEDPTGTQGDENGEQAHEAGESGSGDPGEQPDPPVVGGAVGNSDGAQALQEQVEKALQEGDWSSYFRAKQELTTQESGLSL